MRVTTGQGRTLELGGQLDEGGEGVVYEVRGPPLVAKVLLDPADPADLARRLASLVRRGRSPRMARLLTGEPPRLAWPTATVRVLARHAPDGPVHGFLMPDMRRWFRPLGRILQPAQRAAEFPGATWSTSLAAAASLARLAADLHGAGYVIGDLKPGNLWVDNQGNVGASDVDSFQFSDGSMTFRCLARTADYTAPECMRDPNVAPDSLADDFVLAIVIHQLLMDGMHPFSGIPADGSRYLSIDDNILHGRARIVRPGVVLPMPGAPPLSALPRRLRQEFVRCFGTAESAGGTTRPSALDWATALDAERGAGRLRSCEVSPWHVYTAERPWCPWCDSRAA
jgi:DNA-binding helix-hairpin-helix protein with protein kinase domain